jgi:hypothetical protein
VEGLRRAGIEEPDPLHMARDFPPQTVQEEEPPVSSQMFILNPLYNVGTSSGFFQIVAPNSE